MIKSLDKKWKEFIFAASGFGPNFLMVMMGAYFTDAINPAALGAGSDYQAFATGACYILPAVFPILYAISKAFDGIIDIPFAHITDTLSTKWGRRRPAILVCLIPMALSYAMCWLPIGGVDNQTLNTVWIIVWSLIFFATYTMGMIAFYGSLSTTCADEPQRLRVSGYKAFFDTISYCIVYALVPVILSGARIHIDKFAFIALPLMFTLAIPLFIIKEGEKYGYPENDGLISEKISIKESIYLTFKNKLFLRWLVVNCCTYFGLQMFLVSMNSLILGGMGMSGTEMAILNTCAFAPVPIMLYLFNKLKAKKGIRFAYQTCLAAFAFAILSFFFGSTFVVGIDNKMLQYILGCGGGVVGSWAIGSFFMMPYHITAQISSVEEKLTHKNHSAMYFAANAVCTSIVSAISGSLIYELIKNLFISKETGKIIWATSETVRINGVEFITKPIESAAIELGMIDYGKIMLLTEEAREALIKELPVYNFGLILVPFIVAACCILGLFLAFKMPRDFTADLVAKELKTLDPTVDLEEFKKDESYNVKEEKSEIIFVQIGLWVLSGGIFGFIWSAYLFKSIKEHIKGFKNVLWWALCVFVPFVSAFLMAKVYTELKVMGEQKGVKITGNKWLYIVLGILFPILPLNVVLLALMQKNINKLFESEEKVA
ncbi:MAG: hypothetical protein E7596_00760 [Ruminococcaceae bacterium]|nr:hypothetical protein [Oscillospiraceae bacterium]